MYNIVYLEPSTKLHFIILSIVSANEIHTVYPLKETWLFIYFILFQFNSRYKAHEKKKNIKIEI